MHPLPHPAGSVLAARASRRREQHQKLSRCEDGDLKGREILVNALTIPGLSSSYPFLCTVFYLPFSTSLLPVASLPSLFSLPFHIWSATTLVIAFKGSKR